MSAPEAVTYKSLVKDIITYAERSEQAFVDQVPRFIMLAEQRIALEAKGLGYQLVVEGNFEANDPVVAKPERWRQTKSLFYTDSTGGVRYVQPRKYEYCRMYATGEPAGEPAYYADYDFDHWFFAVTPGSAFKFEVTYYERPVPLSESNQVNWTTRYAPGLLLYAALLEAQPFLKNTNLLSVWQSQYAEMIASLGKENSVYDHDATEATK